MNTKLSCLTSVVLLFGTVAAVWASSGRTTSYPPGPNVWYCYPENIVALVLLVPVAFVAGKWWYSLPTFFGFGVFLVLGPAMGIGFIGNDQRVFSVGHALIANLPVILLCCAAGTVTAWVGFLSSRYFQAKNRSA